MKIFDSTKSEIENSRSSKSNRKKGKTLTEKPAISDSEIREKMAARAEISKTSVQKNTQELGSGFMQESPNTKDFVLKSDVGQNSPTDSMTTEKLKTVLGKGAFNFNSKERDVLESILGKN